jgi:copper homeostasis protein (lipoprotein)
MVQPRRAGLALVATITGACTVGACGTEKEAPAAEEPSLIRVPATFVGVAACAACPEVSVTLTLLGDGTFRMRRSPAEPEARAAAISRELGRWSQLSADELALDGGSVNGLRLRIAGDSLHVSGGEGRAAEAALPRTLVRSREVDAVGDVVELRGMMVYFADAARFTECASGRSYAIAPEGDALALERGYLNAREGPGEPLLVTVRGSITRRPAMEGPDADALVVESFVRAWPGWGCDDEAVDRPIEGVDWVLVELPGGSPVPEGGAASLRLDREDRRVSGSTGCNRYDGSYELTGPRLHVDPTAMTRAVCPYAGLAQVERDFLEALRVTGSARVIGDLLELIGERGVVARLRAAR